MDSVIEGHIAPILYSKNLDPKTLKSITDSTSGNMKHLGLKPEVDNQLILDYLRDNLKQDLHEGKWRKKWLNVIAWRYGFDVQNETAGEHFNEFLAGKNTHIVGSPICTTLCGLRCFQGTRPL